MCEGLGSLCEYKEPKEKQHGEQKQFAKKKKKASKKEHKSKRENKQEENIPHCMMSNHYKSIKNKMFVLVHKLQFNKKSEITLKSTITQSKTIILLNSSFADPCLQIFLGLGGTVNA